MSIENNLKRLADATESIAASLEKLTNTGDTAAAPAAPPAQPAAAPAAPPAQPAAAPAAPPAQPAAAPAPAANLTVEEVNKALVAEFKRLGSREPIDKVMKEQFNGATSINHIDPSQYQQLIDAVKAV